jgi:E3 ubiquitin-protein ligase BRE1
MPVKALAVEVPGFLRPTLNMDDRKRPAVEDPGSTPPLKKQATRSSQANGSSSHPDADMPWKDDLERYQK